MKRLLALLVAAWTAAAVLVGRLKARWYRYRELPTVRDELASGRLTPPARPLALREPAGRLTPADDSREYLSVPSTIALLSGRPARVFRVASTQILPPRPRELAVVREAAWDAGPRRTLPTPGFRAPRPSERPLVRERVSPKLIEGVLDASVFGLDANLATARAEREAPPPLADESLPRHVDEPVEAARLEGPATLAVFDPIRFGLLESGAPPIEDQPFERRVPMRLTRAAANFRAKYLERPQDDRFLRDYPTTFGEEVETGAQGFFEAANTGEVRVENWEINSDVADQMNEVREQYLLRRDIGRPEMSESDLEGVQRIEGLAFDSIQTFTGLEFMDLQPEPVEPLRMQLENPPLDMTPSIDSAQAQLRWLQRAIREHAEDKQP